MPVALKHSFPAKPSYIADVRANHHAVQELMSRMSLDILLVPSHDQFLTAYTPVENSPHYAVSGFDGSVGSGIFVRRELLDVLGCTSQFILFVDGRYHIQAESQTDPALVQVEKLPLGTGIWDGIAAWLAARIGKVGRIGWDPYRTSMAQRARLDLAVAGASVEWVGLENCEFERAIALPGWQVDRPITQLPESVTGRSIVGNLSRLQAAMREHYGDITTCYVTCAADDIGYLLNSRGYHLPNLSSHLGYLFIVGGRAALFLPQACSACPVELDADSVLQAFRNDWTRCLPSWGASTCGRSAIAPTASIAPCRNGRPASGRMRNRTRRSRQLIRCVPSRQKPSWWRFDPLSRGVRGQWRRQCALPSTAALMHYKESSKERELCEGGINFGPASPFRLAPNMVVSVEPGIYLDGRGGVRIENVIVTHRKYDGIRFENLIHVGYDWDLIDLEQLDEDEKEYLRDYERECKRRGTDVTPCPLID